MLRLRHAVSTTLICCSVVVSIHHSSMLQLQRSQINVLSDKFQKGHLQIANKFSSFNELEQHKIHLSFSYEGSPETAYPVELLYFHTENTFAEAK